PIELLRFGARGRALPARPARDIRVDAMLPGSSVQRPDGGAYIVTTDSRLHAVRPDGLPDWTFGGGAVSVDAFSGRYQYGIGPIALRPDGRVLVTGEWDDRPVLVQLTRRGRLDRRFGARGMVRLPFAVEAVRVLRGGDIVGASGSPLRAFRLSRTGARRRRFGRRGVARARGVPRACCHSAEDVVDDARGRLYLLAGNHVAALSRAGRPLRRFGAGGAVALTGGRPLVRTPRGDLLIDSRGGLLAIGSIVVGAAPARCTEREDLCPRQPPPEAQLAVWRVHL
ncbi:MAG TPA: hypothetical protein VGW75_13540, partial [Solirubrobacteraceae bacterium]|nr:hypothetical protein [Solirubrobacteraceae bacterium]